MGMKPVEVTQVISGTPEDAWEVLERIEYYPQVFGSIATTRRVHGTGIQPGTRWAETRRVMGKLENVDCTVMEADRGHRLLWLVDWAGQQVTMCWEFSPASTGTQVKVTFRLVSDVRTKLAKGIMALFGGVTAGVVRDVLKRDISDVSAAVRPVLR